MVKNINGKDHNTRTLKEKNSLLYNEIFRNVCESQCSIPPAEFQKFVVGFTF